MILTPWTKTFSRRFGLENLSGLPQRASLTLYTFLSKNAIMTSISLISIVTPNFPTFLRKRERLSKIVKAADKGGALVVWRADLYQKEALRQLSDTSFYAKVDKDLTSTNQQIVKSTINDLIVKQELPSTRLLISSSPLLELRVCTFYPKFTNLTTQADLSSLRVVALQNLFPAI